jgi:signal transduction histidine kinase
MLANIVHELGRPLGALRAATQALLAGAANEPALRDELLTGIDQEIQRLQRLLDDLTGLRDQVIGAVHLTLQRVTLGEWLAEVLAPWQAAAQAKGLLWRADIPPDMPELAIDPDRLGQALGNLLSNAIKYSPVAGSVCVEAGADESQAWIRVIDNGPGISIEDQARIFAPFERGNQPRRFPQGMGLGLTIARELVEAHGGRLDLESAPGRGSRFTLQLPRN